MTAPSDMRSLLPKDGPVRFPPVRLTGPCRVPTEARAIGRASSGRDVLLRQGALAGLGGASETLAKHPPCEGGRFTNMVRERPRYLADEPTTDVAPPSQRRYRCGQPG